MLVLIEAHVIENKEFRLRAEERRVADAAVFQVQFGLLGDPARIALVMLLGDRVDHVAEHYQRGRLGERIHKRGAGIRNQQHIAFVNGGPAPDAGAVHTEALFKTAFAQLAERVGNVVL